MNLLKHFLIYSVCAAALVLAVYAADKCVECADYDACNDPVDLSVDNKTCTLLDGQVCGMYSYNDTKGKLTFRGCGNKNISCADVKKGLNTLIKDNDTWTCYTCTGDLCNKENSGNSFGVPMVALVLGAMASLYVK